MTRELLDQIIAAPDDDEARLVLADRLVEQGDPRGELIQLQCRLARLTPEDPDRIALERAEQRLLARHEKEWRGPFGGSFERGLLAGLRGTAAKLLPAAAGLFAAAPVTRLTLIALRRNQVPALARAPWLPRLRALTLLESRIGAKGIAGLLGAPGLALRTLHLRDVGIDPAGLDAILSSPGAERLERLDVGPVGRSGIAALVARGLPALRHLGLRWALRGEEGVAFAGRGELPAVESLDLGCNDLGDAGIAALARWPGLGSVRALNLEQCGVSEIGAGELARSPNATGLEELDLSTNRVDGAALGALAQGSLDLSSFSAAQGHAGDDGARALAAAGWTGLRTLRLSYHDLGADGVRALGEGPWPGLRELDLWANHIGPAGGAALAEAPAFRALESLSLGFAELGDDGLAALAGGRWPSLRVIKLRGNNVGAPGATALLQSDGFPALSRIHLNDNKAVPGRLRRALEQKYGRVLMRD